MEEPLLEEPVICLNCRTENPFGTSRCTVCFKPLTAYAGQLDEAPFEGKLGTLVEKLEQRPAVVPAVSVGLVLFALFGPLASVFRAFQKTEKLNAENTNYLAAAFGSLGPIFTTMFMLPLAVLLGILAWGAWSQKPWAWQGCAGVLGVVALLSLLRLSGSPFVGIVGLSLAGAGLVFWLRAETKAWYGRDGIA